MAETLLSSPSFDKSVPLSRTSTVFDPLPALSQPFVTKQSSSAYTQQYANLYFLRLTKLKSRALANASERWAKQDFNIGESQMKPQYVERVLEVEQGQLCYIVGTVYMEMPLKPNVLEDIARDHMITFAPSVEKFCSPEKDEILLEDESGRVRLVGERLKQGSRRFVTGTIIAVLGFETANGDFEVVDVCFPGIPPQPSSLPSNKSDEDTSRSGSSSSRSWIAIISGLELSGADPMTEARASLLSEYLTGQLGAIGDQENVSHISNVIIAGNSMMNPIVNEDQSETKAKKYGYDSSSFNPEPTKAMDAFVSSLLPSIPVVVLPGTKDPTGPIMPQQALHRALLTKSSGYKNFVCTTNPSWMQFDDATFLITSGQTIDDIYRYVEEEDRLQMAEDTLEWSHMSPTAPDTLFCFPFKAADPFIISQTPHVYIVGNQPHFATSLVHGEEGQRCRIVMVPRFSSTNEIVLVDPVSLECQRIRVDIG